MNITDQNPAAERLQPIIGHFRPLDNRVLVRRIPTPAPIFNQNVIIPPEAAQTPSRYGKVIAVGPGKRRNDGSRLPLDVKPGDIVQFGRYTDYDDGSLLLILEDDI